MIYYRDPLAEYLEEKVKIERQLREAANHVGRDVMVGSDVVLWGGKSPSIVGLELHDDVRLYPGCRLVIDHAGPQSGIVLEERVAINFNAYIEGSGGVRIKKRTIIGPNLMLVSSSHNIDPDCPFQASGKTLKPVEIGEDAWIGGNVCILAGVRVGDRAVVGAGSVVTKDVPPGTLVAGNPARIVRSVTWE